MLRVYRYVLPEVRDQLQYWRRKAEEIPDAELQKQAIASMTSKQFHCQGGAVYAVARLQMRHVMIPLIVAFQTISDYLDNLCDRSTSMDPEDFRMLHQSMLDAVDPAEPMHDYYSYRIEKEDGGYLDELVKTCQASLRLLPSYSLVAGHVQELVGLYCDLQVYKHVRQELREAALLDWWKAYETRFPNISWNEFAAATGSTLGVFMLFMAASDSQLKQETVEAIREAYFPYICSLHILLDYLIDQEEDELGGDLNFCSYYDGMDQTVERIAVIVLEARMRADRLEHPSFHRMIIEGLLALYLSDPKVSKQRQVKQISRLLMKGSPLMRMFFFINSILIRKTY
ncbi:tetraprenyl-beta-curcumene synthase family protein [Paenibacillus radicis (ex Xue et al. 2023)]|uniref:Tetraprenyl-beta-curcumene synthase family protein n=1 Tax=Paenibacillus radicis (ex Xue et al. 2023) TaxID=2972489 RepID=A0ABT1YD13_9BACL|nr:tetraprenyl-beta-curcumene synthase family protein [Paenibacillus radicis (ex Xue et al. 2023)]MCR8631089.1 tetraprenyl-beta-curcumene synthase family protein [Paenibacillus radicis (ex Xue et al. 2023)]